MVLFFCKNSDAKLQKLTTPLYFCGWTVPVQQREFVATAVAGGGVDGITGWGRLGMGQGRGLRLSRSGRVCGGMGQGQGLRLSRSGRVCGGMGQGQGLRLSRSGVSGRVRGGRVVHGRVCVGRVLRGGVVTGRVLRGGVTGRVLRGGETGRVLRGGVTGRVVRGGVTGRVLRGVESELVLRGGESELVLRGGESERLLVEVVLLLSWVLVEVVLLPVVMLPALQRHLQRVVHIGRQSNFPLLPCFPLHFCCSKQHVTQIRGPFVLPIQDVILPLPFLPDKDVLLLVVLL